MRDDGGLKQLLPQHLPRFHWQRVETSTTGPGVPDLNACCDGVEVWVEAKRTRAWAVALAPAQVGWLLRRTRAGGRCFVAVRRIARDADELHIVPGALARELRLGGLRANLPGRIAFESGPSGWDWGAVEDLLLGVKRHKQLSD